MKTGAGGWATIADILWYALEFNFMRLRTLGIGGEAPGTRLSRFASRVPFAIEKRSGRQTNEPTPKMTRRLFGVGPGASGQDDSGPAPRQGRGGCGRAALERSQRESCERAPT